MRLQREAATTMLASMLSVEDVALFNYLKLREEAPVICADRDSRRDAFKREFARCELCQVGLEAVLDDAPMNCEAVRLFSDHEIQVISQCPPLRDFGLIVTNLLAFKAGRSPFDEPLACSGDRSLNDWANYVIGNHEVSFTNVEIIQNVSSLIVGQEKALREI